MLKNNSNQKSKIKKNSIKPTIFVATDSPAVDATGFGRVCRELVTRWVETGKYKIVCMGTNDRGEYHPIKQLSPDLIIEPLPFLGEDPYGIQRMPELLKKYQPDLVWSLNDLWVWTGDERTQNMDHWFYRHLKGYKPYVPWIGYFPVDGVPWTRKWIDCCNSMAYAVTFNNFGFNYLNSLGIEKEKIKKILHAHDNKSFHPIDEELKLKMRDIMGIPRDAFLVTMVNRNQPRKNIPAVMMAFKYLRSGYVICSKCGHYHSLDIIDICQYCGSTSFKEGRNGIENSYLYLHMDPMDMRGYVLPRIQNNLKLTNVITRLNHDVAHGVPTEELNVIYNTSDVTVNTCLAGGHELTVTESQSAGTPVIATRTTSVIELLENDKGILVDPSSVIVLNDANMCFKHVIDVDKLTDAMFYMHDNPDVAAKLAENALQFANLPERTWDVSAKQFEDLIDSALIDRIVLSEKLNSEKQNIVFVSENNNFGNALSAACIVNKLAENNPQLTVKYAVRERIIPILKELNNIEIIDVDKLWLDSDLGKYQVKIQAIDDIPARFETAGLIANPDNVLSCVESYSKGLNVPFDFKHLDKFYNLTIEENIFAENAMKLISEDALENKFKLTILVEASNSNFGVSIENYQQMINFIKKQDNVSVIAIGYKGELDKLENVDMKVTEKTLREILAIISKSDCVVTTSDEYVHLANFMTIPFVIIQGPKELRHIAKHSKAYDQSKNKSLVQFVSNKGLFGCMPCMKQPHDQCGVNHSIRAECMNKINSGEVFARVLGIKKYWENKKDKAIKIET